MSLISRHIISSLWRSLITAKVQGRNQMCRVNNGLLKAVYDTNHSATSRQVENVNFMIYMEFRKRELWALSMETSDMQLSKRA